MAAPASPAPVRLRSPAERWHRPAFILFLLAWGVNWVLALLCIELPPEAGWIEASLLLTATFTTLIALGRRLPLQNVLTAGLLLGGLGSVIIAVTALSGVPFGPVVYGDALGERMFGVVPWAMPLIWIVLVMNGRGVARLIMRPWRRTNFYGYWVIALTCLLAVVFELGFEPFAVKVKGYWLWRLGPSVLTWQTAPWVNFLGWFVSVLGLLAFSIPWLINKQPVKQPTDYHPLVLWVLLNLWIATGNSAHGLWGATAVSVAANAVAITYAIRGARW
jgi:uncharacterized membrane protein